MIFFKFKFLLPAKTIIPFFFFLIYLISGLFIFDNYGISWDEEVQRLDNGYANYQAVFHNERETLDGSEDKYHGPLFEVILVIAEKALGTNDTRAIYQLRHLLSFLLFFTGVIFFYFLLLIFFADWRVALLGCAMLVLNPRTFAESFYNSKDTPFLAVFIIAIYVLFRFFRNQTLWRAILFSVSTAALIAIRILGILLPAFLLFLILQEVIVSNCEKRKPVIKIIPMAVAAVLIPAFTILFWPVLWHDPLNEFITAFDSMRQFHWESSLKILGREYDGFHIPWFYIPVWFTVSNPLLYLLLFLAGLISIGKGLYSSFYSVHAGDLRENSLRSLQLKFILIGWFFIPVLAIIILRSVVYDGWRHLFFIYPAFVGISLSGFVALREKTRNANGRYSILKHKIVLPVFFILLLGLPLKFIIENHPCEYVYFNALVPKPGKYFDMDYWGLSYREALEYISEKDKSPQITFAAANMPGALNLQILPLETRKRMKFVDDPELADYFIDNFRWRKTDIPFAKEIYSSFAGSSKIISAYKLKTRKRQVLYRFQNDFEKPADSWISNSVIEQADAYSGKKVNRLDSLHPKSNILVFSFDSSGALNENIFISISFWIKHFSPYSQAEIIIEPTSITHDATSGIEISLTDRFVKNTLPGRWKYQARQVELSKMILSENQLSVYIWNADGKKIYLDDITVEIIGVNKE